MGVSNTEGLARFRLPVAVIADGLESLASRVDDRMKALSEGPSSTIGVEAAELAGRLSDLAAVLHRELGRAELDRDHAIWLVSAGCRLLPAVETFVETTDERAGLAWTSGASMLASDTVERCRAAFEEVTTLEVSSTGSGAAGAEEGDSGQTDQRLHAALSAVRRAFLHETEDQPTTRSSDASMIPSQALRPASTVDDVLPARFFAGVVGEVLSLVAVDTGQAAGSVRLLAKQPSDSGTRYEYSVDVTGEARALVAAQLGEPLVSPISLLSGADPTETGSGLILRDAQGIEVGVNDAAGGNA